MSSLKCAILVLRNLFNIVKERWRVKSFILFGLNSSAVNYSNFVFVQIAWYDILSGYLSKSWAHFYVT